MMLIMCVSFMFLMFTHPLWMSLIVFICSILMALTKFFYGGNMNLFIFLFIMVYSGGLLMMLVYMSSLVPNFNLMNYSYMIMMFVIMIMIFSVYTEKYFCFFSEFGFSLENIFSMNHVLSSKEMLYSIIFLLLFCFCVVASVLNMFKYPMRSL
uniref:NADH dehydrogenase subunit 6 n=1 Tax=Capillaria sp. cat-2018 TaxID=2488633 RepID=A0A6M2UJ96_9BILA|nr:NADH dehydrogenase subunit 6 [Capillaria sp. cat-2018]